MQYKSCRSSVLFTPRTISAHIFRCDDKHDDMLSTALAVQLVAPRSHDSYEFAVETALCMSHEGTSFNPP